MVTYFDYGDQAKQVPEQQANNSQIGILLLPRGKLAADQRKPLSPPIVIGSTRPGRGWRTRLILLMMEVLHDQI